MDWPEREDEVRLRLLEMVDEVLEGPWLVLVVDVVEVEGVRRDNGAIVF